MIVKIKSVKSYFQGKQNSEYLEGLSMIGVQQIDRVVEVVEETLKVILKLVRKKSGKCLSKFY